MGPVTSMCCESSTDIKKIGNPQILPIPPKIDIKSKNKEIKIELEDEKLNQFVEQKFEPTDKKIKFDDFKIEYKIGEGGFGDVSLCVLKDEQKQGIDMKYAIKKVTKQSIRKGKLKQNIKLEKKILQESNSPFITCLHFAFRDSDNLYFVMEWAEGGDTYSLIKQGSKRVEQFKKKGEEAVRFILACVIMGLEYLHKINVMYRDLKPQNVLIFKNGYIKLTDFGLAKTVNQNEQSKTEAGTILYYAPEMVLRNGYNKEIDLWTLGVYAFQLSTCNSPFSSAEIKDKQKLKKLIKAAEVQRDWKKAELSPELKNFIDSLLKFEPSQRLGFQNWENVKNHQFFQNFDWKSLQELRMPSPIKDLIQKFPNKLQKYNPNAANKKNPISNPEPNAVQDNDLNGWTYQRK